MSQDITVTLIKSHIGKPHSQRAVLNGMGLNKLNKSVTLKDTPEIRGMIRKVSHMVNVTE